MKQANCAHHSVKSFSSAAFTLAEVLITLAIIGVVASLTIPSLMNNINKQDTVAKVKKAYSVLSQATQSINADCGGNIKGCISSLTSATDNDPDSRKEVAALYKAKLIVNKDCTGTDTGCFANTMYKLLDNDGWINLGTADFCTNSELLLNDGTSVCFDWDGGSYSNQTSSLFQIHVDINGPQPPNQLGKDVFIFTYISNSGSIKPFEANDCTTINYGWGCAAKIFKEGAINYY